MWSFFHLGLSFSTPLKEICMQKLGAVFTMFKYGTLNKIVVLIPATSHCTTFTERRSFLDPCFDIRMSANMNEIGQKLKIKLLDMIKVNI